MALTTAQQALLLFKKLLGKSQTTSSRDFFEEPYNAPSNILSSQIWTDSSLIPTQSAAFTGSGHVIGVVKYVADLSLTAVAGTTNAFQHDSLRDAIPFNFGNGSYNYTLKNNIDASIPFGSGDWLVDTESGVVSFYSSVPSNMPPKITFYQYVGTKGFVSASVGTATSASYATTSSYALNSTALPTGLVSSSAQVSYPAVSNIPTGIVSSSAQVSYPSISNIPVGIVSSSAQINTGSFLGNIQGSASYALNAGTANNATSASAATSITFIPVTASYANTATIATTAATASYVVFTNIGAVPALVSASSQISYTGITNIPVGIVSSSTQISYVGLSNIPVGIISASSQVSYGGLTGIPTGLVSSSTQVNTGSFSGDIDGTASYALVAQSLLGSISSATSASYALTASYALNGGSGGGGSSPTASYISGTAWVDGGTYISPSMSLVDSASYALIAGIALTAYTASYVFFSNITSVPVGIVSSSAQISYTDITNVPIGLVSASTQISYAGITNIPSGIVSSSVQINTGSFLGDIQGSASYALNAGTANNATSASAATSITFIPATASYASVAQTLLGSITSASYALTASYALNGGGSPAPTAATRQLTTLSSSISLAQSQHETGSAYLSAGFVLYLVRTDQPLRIRLYSRVQSRDLDLLRGVNVEPTGSHDVILDLVTTSTQLTGTLAPFPFGAMLDEPATGVIPYTITNLQTGSVFLSASIMFLPLE